MTDDVRDTTTGTGGDGPSGTALSARIEAAVALLEGCPGEEYDALSTTDQVHVQEAIEHLRRVQSSFRGGGPGE